MCKGLVVKTETYLILKLHLRVSNAAHELRCALDVLLSRHAVVIFEEKARYANQLLSFVFIAALSATCSRARAPHWTMQYQITLVAK